MKYLGDTDYKTDMGQKSKGSWRIIGGSYFVVLLGHASYSAFENTKQHGIEHGVRKGSISGHIRSTRQKEK
jgi:hypothetical protein